MGGVRQPWTHKTKPSVHICEVCGRRFQCTEDHVIGNVLTCPDCRKPRTEAADV